MNGICWHGSSFLLSTFWTGLRNFLVILHCSSFPSGKLVVLFTHICAMCSPKGSNLPSKWIGANWASPRKNCFAGISTHYIHACTEVVCVSSRVKDLKVHTTSLRTLPLTNALLCVPLQVEYKVPGSKQKNRTSSRLPSLLFFRAPTGTSPP